MRGRTVKGLAVVAVLVAFGTAWWFFAPTQLGGKTSYAVTFGVSMEPHFHQGDLVVLRRQSRYHVGEVVAYRSHDLKKNVLHRIIAVHGGRFTFKGDNNDFVDPERPTQADLVGAEWLHIPSAGAWLASLHSPRNAAIAAFVIVLLLMLTGGGTVARRRRRRVLPRPVPRQAAPKPSTPAPSIGFAVAGVGAGALCAAVVLGLVAFTRPLERSLVWSNLYVQHGRFSYTAKVTPNATYQSPVVRSGDPVYLSLVHRLPVAFTYRLQTDRPGPLAGAASFSAILRDDEGWRHVVPLSPPQRFTGAATRLRGILDLDAIEHVIAAFEHQTGEHNTLYHVTLAARVAIKGTVDARPLSTTFAPALQLDLDAYRLAVVQPNGPSATPNTLAQSQSGSGRRIETAYVHALGRGFTVAHARRLATLLGIAGIVLAVAGGLLTLLGRRDEEVPAILRKYENWIVDVLPDARRSGNERRVPSMEALARLAQRYERLILHERREHADAFLVEDDGVVYSYVVHDWTRATAAVTP